MLCSIDGLSTIETKCYFILFYFVLLELGVFVNEFQPTQTREGYPSTHSCLLCFIHKITLNANITYWIGQESVVNWLRWKGIQKQNEA